MILYCTKCDRSFDAETEPETCPFCGKAASFGIITITDENGRKLTYKEHIDELREYYLSHLPYGHTRADIETMDDRDLEDMDYFLNE